MQQVKWIVLCSSPTQKSKILTHYQCAFTVIMSDKRRKYYIVLLLGSKMDEGV